MHEPADEGVCVREAPTSPTLIQQTALTAALQDPKAINPEALKPYIPILNIKAPMVLLFASGCARQMRRQRPDPGTPGHDRAALDSGTGQIAVRRPPLRVIIKASMIFRA